MTTIDEPRNQEPRGKSTRYEYGKNLLKIEIVMRA